MSTFRAKIITSNRVFFEGQVEIMIVPGLYGEKGFMAHHEEMVIALNMGEIRYKTGDGEWHYCINGYGVAQAANNRLTVIVETAEKPEELDAVKAQEERDRALEEMRQKQSIQEYKESQATLARALNRLKYKEIRNI